MEIILPFPLANPIGVQELISDIEKQINDFQSECTEEDMNIIAGLNQLINQIINKNL